MDRARGLATRSRWIEQAVIEKLVTDGVLVAPTEAAERCRGPAAPELEAERKWPRRPAPRQTAGRRVS